ncbi:hypothetical protein OEM_42500 [Mycobacterium intracellulare subsp. yongonense 05-1390]|nr:hypothetical protein OEM_42500 [Mycobacterium intracellulare subsp. yongonense 05-1390]
MHLGRGRHPHRRAHRRTPWLRSAIGGALAAGKVITATPGLGEVQIRDQSIENDCRYQYSTADLMPKA